MGLLANPVYCVEKSTSKFNSTLKYDVPVYLTKQMTLNNIGKEIVYLKSIRKTDGATETHVFNNTEGETLTKDYLYFVRVTDLQGNETVAESRIYSADEFPHTKVYGMCDAKCKVEVPTMEQFNAHINKMAVVTTDFLTCEKEHNGTGYTYSASTYINYPEGFNNSNCIVLAIRAKWYNESKNAVITRNQCRNDRVALNADNVFVYGEWNTSFGIPYVKFEVVLLRTDA